MSLLICSCHAGGREYHNSYLAVLKNSIENKPFGEEFMKSFNEACDAEEKRIEEEYPSKINPFCKVHMKRD